MDRPCSRKLPAGLYAITPEHLFGEALYRAVAVVLGAGITVLQYRPKRVGADQRRADAGRLVALCRAHGVCSIINDDPQLAAEAGADGVHLGEHDGSIAAARKLLGLQSIIGVSCYDEWHRVESAVSEGADYLALGAFFPSRSKQTQRRASLELLQRTARFPLPVVAIGGIREDNAAPLIAAGAHGIAVIDALWSADDPAASAAAFARLFAPR
ncbi:thiamine phosphate synthase [Pseudomarimonas arenosa]|uniref:Thiamine-phosphate synthase n=1 Tax=Pseudomarimonas arenosa TaxID=2774145 RepID=A0AAW3ZKZ2_9GAMM|nr:thiamine phosphate synthase [Pseudomarimonas arenosa]MBD8525101.1 thiamine phosphate synthase [Pseudomarimonas arenosa]